MFLLFSKSIQGFIRVYLEALRPQAIQANPLSLNRLLFLFILFPFILGLQIIHFIGFFLDDLFFKNYRNCKINQILFIVGIPRSGTTYLHRRIAQSQKTTTLSTWEAILAPSIIEKKCLCILARMDRFFGQPFKKTISKLIRFFSGDFQRVHPVTIDAPEEDYLTLLPIGACAILCFAFPQSKALKQLLNFEEMDAREKATILKFYHSNIQRHLYHHDSECLYLSKNAAFCTWLSELKIYFPQAKFILTARNPRTAIPSQLNALNSARKLFGSDPNGQLTHQIITSAFQKNYRSLINFLANTPKKDRQLIHQEALRTNSQIHIEETLEALGLDLNLPRETTEEKESPRYSQTKKISSSDKDPIDPSVEKSYKELIKITPNRSIVGCPEPKI